MTQCRIHVLSKIFNLYFLRTTFRGFCWVDTQIRMFIDSEMQYLITYGIDRIIWHIHEICDFYLIQYKLMPLNINKIIVYCKCRIFHWHYSILLKLDLYIRFSMVHFTCIGYCRGADIQVLFYLFTTGNRFVKWCQALG